MICPEEIPAGFFDTAQPQPQRQTRQDQNQFAACKDGSGGFCIPLGQCSADKKPDTQNAKACEAGEECCFGCTLRKSILEIKYPRIITSSYCSKCAHLIFS